MRYTNDQEDACKDWGLVEPGMVRPHHGCAHTLGAPVGLGFHPGTFACMEILVMLASDFN
jgi:hypothetical protein